LLNKLKTYFSSGWFIQIAFFLICHHISIISINLWLPQTLNHNIYVEMYWFDSPCLKKSRPTAKLIILNNFSGSKLNNQDQPSNLNYDSSSLFYYVIIRLLFHWRLQYVVNGKGIQPPNQKAIIFSNFYFITFRNNFESINIFHKFNF
jgi:hypothetical protein